jgi:hypothetical protein
MQHEPVLAEKMKSHNCQSSRLIEMALAARLMEMNALAISLDLAFSKSSAPNGAAPA